MKKWGVQGLKNLTQIKLLEWRVKDSILLYNTPKTVLPHTLVWAIAEPYQWPNCSESSIVNSLIDGTNDFNIFSLKLRKVEMLIAFRKWYSQPLIQGWGGSNLWFATY